MAIEDRSVLEAMELILLTDFHRQRLQVPVGAGPNLLAFETIPNKLEAQLCSYKIAPFVGTESYVVATSLVCNVGFHTEVDETQDIDLIQPIEKVSKLQIYRYLIISSDSSSVYWFFPNFRCTNKKIDGYTLSIISC
nr:homocysteine S-methyltransferase 1 [Ipomoea batatas]